MGGTQVEEHLEVDVIPIQVQMTYFLRCFIVCVPVGGIPVKEHFEVNVAPIQIQMTYQLYKAVMQFFFPDKNIETDDGELGSI